MEIGFRRMELTDLELLERWLQDPEVQHWFRHDDLSPEGVRAHYGPGIRGESADEQWLALVDGREVGWFQTYPVTDDAAYAAACARVGFDPAGGGIDYLVGRPEDRDRGLGSTLIRRFTLEVGFAHHPRWPMIGSSPEPDNARSWRALEKAGFRFLGDIEAEDGPERLMAVDRPA